MAHNINKDVPMEYGFDTNAFLNAFDDYKAYELDIPDTDKDAIVKAFKEYFNENYKSFFNLYEMNKGYISCYDTKCTNEFYIDENNILVADALNDTSYFTTKTDLINSLVVDILISYNFM